MTPESRRSWRCGAKLNLYLRVLPRRADGFHGISSVFVPISLADTLSVAPDADYSLTITSPSRPPIEVPAGSANLVSRAVEALATHAGVAPRVRVELVKRIPAAAGLGGGSSDAGGALLA
ncbi:MAG: 4-(cytidine 5'-diphospho)-2-C-methyl-D-erythritol kinase, partial [Actinomycetota bacterium]|nr:4-(cytidine 5'-diphospho)-2-C-methyl-D-erythritol kinase [Actinomycetota bacterium]